MNAVRDNLTFLKGALDLITEGSTADTGAATWVGVTRAASTDYALRALVTGDAVARGAIYADGSYEMGAGGASNRDVRLRRSAARVITLDAIGGAGATALYIEGAAGSAANLVLRQTGDANDRVALEASGAGTTQLSFGDGSAARDTNLYRNSAADRLKTDDHFTAALGVATFTKAGSISDADWASAPPVGTIAIDISNWKIYVRTGSATWKSTAALT